jgi:hypothetical protein
MLDNPRSGSKVWEVLDGEIGKPRENRGQNHQAYLWQYGTPGGATVFDFRMSRGREGPARFLGQFEGILQTDDYIAYERGSVGRRWCTRPAGLIREGALWMP